MTADNVPTTTTAQPPWRSELQNDGQRASHGEWITGRIMTLLQHYYQPDAHNEVKEAAFHDWVSLLSDFSQRAIEHACGSYLQDQPRRRPTPGDIIRRCEAYRDKMARKSQHLTEVEVQVADFAVRKGWLSWGVAQQVIIEGRGTAPDIVGGGEVMDAVYAVRMAAKETGTYDK